MSTGMLCQKVEESVRNKKYFSFLFTFFEACDIMYIGGNNMEQTTVKNILYDPRSDTYKIMVGDRMVEVPDYPLRSERLNMLKDALLKDALKDPLYDIDAFRRDYLGDWAEAARAETATEAEEAARAGVIPMKNVTVPWDVYTHGKDVILADAQGHKYSIIGDWLAKDEKTENPVSIYTRGTVGASVSVLKPDCPTITVYSDKKTAKDQHDRYPSIPYRALIKDAIELLNKNKKLRLSKISLNRFETDYILTVSSRGHTALGKTPVRTIEVSINLAAFDRTLKTELDNDAGLGEGLDTNTYIKLRIAFLLYRALSMKDEEAKKFWAAGIFRVMSSTTQFDYST